MIDIEDLFQVLTEDEVLETFLSNLETAGVGARSWRKGGALRTMLRVVAKTYAGFTSVLSVFVKSAFLETAEKGWLTLHARYVFGVERPTATFATGDLQFTNAGGGVFAFNPDEVRALWEATGKAYVNDEAFTLNPGETKLVSFRAVEIGSASSAPPGAIQKLETVLLGVTVTNPEALVGSDELSDDELKQLCRDKRAALSLRGPRGAYSYAVKVAKRPDGTPVNVNRISISPSSSTGIVTVYCAAPSGAPSTSDLDYVKDSIEAHARPDSVTANVLAATEVALSRSLTVWVRQTDGLSATDVETLVDNALIAMIADYPIGGIPKPPSATGYLWASMIDGTVKAAHPSIYAVDGVGADVALAAGQVVTLATTITVRMVTVT